MSDSPYISNDVKDYLRKFEVCYVALHSAIKIS